MWITWWGLHSSSAKFFSNQQLEWWPAGVHQLLRLVQRLCQLRPRHPGVGGAFYVYLQHHFPHTHTYTFMHALSLLPIELHLEDRNGYIYIYCMQLGLRGMLAAWPLGTDRLACMPSFDSLTWIVRADLPALLWKLGGPGLLRVSLMQNS